MFQRLKDVKEYKGKEPLLSGQELEDLLNWKHGSTYAAVSNNGFLDVYIERGRYKFDKNHAKALLKCDTGSLMGYRGIDSMTENAGIFESELVRLANDR
jgi:hypothetical protein